MISVIIKEWFRSWVLWAWTLFISLLASEVETVPKLPSVDGKDEKSKKKKTSKTKKELSAAEFELDDEKDATKREPSEIENDVEDEEKEHTVQVICIDVDDADDEFEDEEEEEPAENGERLIDSEDVEEEEEDEEFVSASITLGKIPPQQRINKDGVSESVKVDFQMKINKNNQIEEHRKGSNITGSLEEKNKLEDNDNNEEDEEEIPWLGAGRGTGLTRYPGVQNLVTHNGSPEEPNIERRMPISIPRREGPLILSRSSLIRSLSGEKERLELIPEEEKDSSPKREKSLLDESDKLWASLVARYSDPEPKSDQTTRSNEGGQKSNNEESEAFLDSEEAPLFPAEDNMTSKEFSAQVGQRLQTYLAKIEDQGKEEVEEKEDFISTDETREIDIEIADTIDVGDITENNNKIFIVIEDDESSDGKVSDSHLKADEDNEQDILNQPSVTKDENTEIDLSNVRKAEVNEFTIGKLADVNKQTPTIIIDEVEDVIVEEKDETVLEETTSEEKEDDPPSRVPDDEGYSVTSVANYSDREYCKSLPLIVKRTTQQINYSKGEIIEEPSKGVPSIPEDNEEYLEISTKSSDLRESREEERQNEISATELKGSNETVVLEVKLEADNSLEKLNRKSVDIEVEPVVIARKESNAAENIIEIEHDEGLDLDKEEKVKLQQQQVKEDLNLKSTSIDSDEVTESIIETAKSFEIESEVTIKGNELDHNVEVIQDVPNAMAEKISQTILSEVPEITILKMKKENQGPIEIPYESELNQCSELNEEQLDGLMKDGSKETLYISNDKLETASETSFDVTTGSFADSKGEATNYSTARTSMESLLSMDDKAIIKRNEEEKNIEITKKSSFEEEETVPKVTVLLRKGLNKTSKHSSQALAASTGDVSEVTFILPKKKKSANISTGIEKDLLEKEIDDEKVSNLEVGERHKSRDLWQKDYEKLIEEQKVGDLDDFYRDREADVFTTTYEEFPEDCVPSSLDEMRKSPLQRNQETSIAKRREENTENEISKSKSRRLAYDASEHDSDDESNQGYLLAKEMGALESPDEADESEFTFVLPISRILKVSELSKKEKSEDEVDESDIGKKPITKKPTPKDFLTRGKSFQSKLESYADVGLQMFKKEHETEKPTDSGSRCDTIFYQVLRDPEEDDDVAMLDVASNYPRSQAILEEEEEEEEELTSTHFLVEPVMKEMIDAKMPENIEAMQYVEENYEDGRQSELEKTNQIDQQLDTGESATMLTEDDQRLITVLTRKFQYGSMEFDKKDNDVEQVDDENSSDGFYDKWENKHESTNEGNELQTSLKPEFDKIEKDDVKGCSVDNENNFPFTFRESEDVTMATEDELPEPMAGNEELKEEEMKQTIEEPLTPEVMSDKELILNLIRSERSQGNDGGHIEDEIPDYLEEVKDLLVPRARRKKAKRRYKELDEILKIAEEPAGESEGATAVAMKSSGTAQYLSTDIDKLYQRRPDSTSDSKSKFLLTEEEERELAEIKTEQDAFKAAQRRELEKYLAMPCGLTEQEQQELDELLADEASDKIAIAKSEARLEALLAEVRKRVGGSELELSEEEFERYSKLPAGLTEEEEQFFSYSPEQERDRSEFDTEEEYREYVKLRYLQQLEEDQARIEEEEYEYGEYDDEEYEYEDDYEYEDEGLEGEYIVEGEEEEVERVGFTSTNDKAVGSDQTMGAEAATMTKHMKKDLSVSSSASKSSKGSKGSLDKASSRDSLPEDTKDKKSNQSKKFFRFGSLSVKRKKKSNEFAELDPQIDYLESIKENLDEVEHNKTIILNHLKDEGSIQLNVIEPGGETIQTEKLKVIEPNITTATTTTTTIATNSTESVLTDNEMFDETTVHGPENLMKKQMMLSLLKKMQTMNAANEVVEKAGNAKLSPELKNKFIHSPSNAANEVKNICSPTTSPELKHKLVHLNPIAKYDTENELKNKNISPTTLKNSMLMKDQEGKNDVTIESPVDIIIDDETVVSDASEFNKVDNSDETVKTEESTYDEKFRNNSSFTSKENEEFNLSKTFSVESFEKGFWNDWEVVESNNKDVEGNDAKIPIVEDSFVVIGLTSDKAKDDFLEKHNKQMEGDPNMDQLPKMDETRNDPDECKREIKNGDPKVNEPPNIDEELDKTGSPICLSISSSENTTTTNEDIAANYNKNTMMTSEGENAGRDRITMGNIPIPNDNYNNKINAQLEMAHDMGMTYIGDIKSDVANNKDAAMSHVTDTTPSSARNSKQTTEPLQESFWPEEEDELWPEDSSSKVVLDEFEQMEKEVLLEMEKEKAVNGEKKKEGDKKGKKKKKRKGDAEKENKKTAYQSKDELYEKHVGPRIRSFDAAKMKSKFNKPKEPTQVSSDCRICGKQVFQMEKIVAEKASWHKNCFRCKECNKNLTLETYQSHEGSLYCKPHFKELFRPKAVVQDEAEERKDRLLRRPRMIILESQPEILPDDVVRATSKPDYGLEELQTLNVKDRFSLFENLSKESDEPKIESIAVRRSQSLMSKVARMQDGQNDEDEEELEDEYDNENEEEGESEESGGEENPDYVKSKKKKERPMSFSGMRDLKAAWEQKQRREEMSQSRKEEISKFRLMLCAGKNSSLKEKFESGQFDDHDDDDKPREEIKIDGKRAASNLMKKFEKGRPFIMDDDNSEDEDSAASDSDEPRIRNSFVGEKHEVEEIFKEAETAKKARNVFKQIDSKLSQEGTAAVMRSHSFAQNNKENRLSVDVSYLNPQTTPSSAEVVKADDKAEEFKLDTSDLMNRFKFFSTYEEREKKEKEEKRKVFRITPPREGVDQGLTLSDDLEGFGRDPNLIKCTDNYEDDIDCRNTKNILQMFKKMEKGDDDEDEDEGPRPLKRFTPPLNDGEYEDSEEEYSDEEYSEDEEESEEEEEDENGVRKPKLKDELLQMLSARKAASLRAKFERWETEVDRQNDINKEDPEEECRPSLDTARNLKAMFEHKANEVAKPVSSKPIHQKVNRFV